MFRRIIATVTIVCFFAGQWAAIPHAHAAASQVPGHAHSAKPHLHFSWFFHGSPAHKHSHHGRVHGDYDHKHHESSPVPTNSFGHGDDHDADALYLPTGTPSPDRGDGSSFKWQVTKASQAVIAISDSTAADLGQASFQQHPPDARAPNCALYLKLRTLRI